MGGVTHGYDDSHWNKKAVPGYDETAAVMNLIPHMDGKWRDTYETARFGFVCEVPSSICTDASSAEVRPNVKEVLLDMAECTTVSPMRSESIGTFSFVTRCDSEAPPSTSQPLEITSQPSGDLESTGEKDDDKTVLILVIVALGAFVFILVVVVIVLWCKFRKASDSANREINPTYYGNSSA